jgi:UDP-N-acetylmuramoylalanine--D-glutamate ligase
MTWSPTLFAGRRYAVVGLGRNGLPAARALVAMGADVSVWDDGEAARADAGLPLHDPALGYAGFDALVLSPGIPHTVPAPHPAALAARAAAIPILSDAELLFQAVRASGSAARFVGITGTNGKSTTTALLHHILVNAGVDSAAGGNLGIAALALPLLGDNGVYVLEMSSYMLERLTTLRFDVAALLNLSPDHLDRHGGMAGYIAAKRHIFDRAPGLAVLGIDDPDTAAIAAGMECLTVSGSTPPAIDMPALPGPHNAQNAAAATAMARALGLSDAAIASGLQSFPGLPHRQQRIAVIDGVAWINDSKATNADAAARALGCYDRIVWIAGGQSKAGGIEPLAPLFPRIAHALLIGRDAPILAATLTDHGVPHSIPGTLDAAVAAARGLARKLDATTVLLSPACASWDQFSSFEARGDRFRDLVLNDTIQRSA